MLAEPPRPYIYLPLAQNMQLETTLVVRTKSDPAGALASVRSAVAAIDPHLPLFGVRTMDEHLANSVFAFMPMRMGAWLSGVQGAIGLFLAVTGLFAVVAAGVAQRTAELGIRVALGATPARVVRLVVREGMRLTLIGAIIGLVLAFGFSAVLAQVLHGARAGDPWVLGGAVLLLGATTALACWLPARRAARVDPLTALRAE